MQDPRAAVSAACCCEEQEEVLLEEEEEEEGSLLLLLLPLFSLQPFPPPASSSLTSNSRGQFFPVRNSLARRTSGGAPEAAASLRVPSSTAIPLRTSTCPCGPELEAAESGAEEEAAAARALGRRSGASTHPTTAPVRGSTRATQGVPQTFAQSSPSDSEALPAPAPPFGFLPPPRPKSGRGSAFAAAAVPFEAEEEEEEEEEELPEEESSSRDLTAFAGTHSSSLRLKTSTLFFLSLPCPPSPPTSSSVTVIVLSALETFRASAKVILEEPSDRATAEAAGTNAAPQPSPSGVLVSSEAAPLGPSGEPLFFEPPAPPARPPLLRPSAAPPSASAESFVPISPSVELRSASASCQKALPESQVSWRSLEGEDDGDASFPSGSSTLVSPSPKASSGSLAVLRTFPDSRSTSLTVDLPLRPGDGWKVFGGVGEREERGGRRGVRSEEEGRRKEERKKRKILTCRLPEDVPAPAAAAARRVRTRQRVGTGADPVELEPLGEGRAVVAELADRPGEEDRDRRRRRQRQWRRRRGA